jgi:hypothetical protein
VEHRYEAAVRQPEIALAIPPLSLADLLRINIEATSAVHSPTKTNIEQKHVYEALAP